MIWLVATPTYPVGGSPDDAEPDPPRPVPESVRVRAHVHARFVELGFTDLAAEALADAGADWHEAQQLLLRGCPHPCVVDLLL